MGIPPRRLLTHSALLALAAVTWWIAGYLTPREEGGASKDKGVVDYYSKNLRRTVMKPDGRPKEHLVAESLTHYPEDDHVDLTRPVMTLYSENGPPWVIHSETALLPGASDLIYMNGDVFILRDAKNGGEPLRITTRNVKVERSKDYAETAEFVRVLTASDEMTGNGAQVYFGDDLKVTILSNVKRKHEVEAH